MAAMSWPALVFSVLVGYVVGSIPVAGLVARRRAGVDLRQVGDRNPGYWNAKETLGRRAAVPVFIGDAAKGAIAAGIGWIAGGGHWPTAYAAAAAAMIGHAFPVFAGFRGGRSVLTFAGAVCVLSPVTAAVAIGALLVVFAATRSFAWGARVAVFGFPLVQLAIDGPYRTAGTGCLMSIIGLRFAMAALTDRRRRPAQEG
jgi:acyl phosphate:glycerol-3-phosphate acyltransferase